MVGVCFDTNINCRLMSGDVNKGPIGLRIVRGHHHQAARKVVAPRPSIVNHRFGIGECCGSTNLCCG